MEQNKEIKLTREELYRQMKEGSKTAWNNEQVQEYLRTLSTDELLDELLAVHRAHSISHHYEEAMIAYIRMERYERSKKNLVVDENFVKQLERANQRILDAAKSMYDDYTRLIMDRSNTIEHPKDYIYCYARNESIDRSYTFGYSHPIDEKDYWDLVHLIYGENGSIPGLEFGIRKPITDASVFPPLSEITYPKHPDSPDEERSWNKLVGLESVESVRVCCPIFTMLGEITFEDIFAIKGYYHVITIEHSNATNEKVGG